MKKLLASVSALAFCATAGAQDTPPEAHGSACDYTDGGNEVGWKLTNPSGASDWWNSFKSTDCAGVKVDALAADFLETAGFAGAHAEIGVYPDLGGGVPDIGSPIAARVAPVNASDAFNTDAYYSVPVTTMPSTGVHVAARYTGGDSHLWMNMDTTTNLGRTFFTTSSYATGAVAFTGEIDMYLGTPNFGAPGCLLFNGGSSATVQQNDVICVDFIGPAFKTLFILYFCINGNPFIQLLPLAFTQTDHPIFGGSCPNTWQLCTTLNCNTPVAGPLEFCTLYADKTDLKVNGKPKIKLGKSAFLTITADPFCGGGGSCFGQKDDCFVDANIWKVQNPAGPSDWFNVNHGVPTSGVTTLESASVSSWDFCGFGPCWANVGIYPSNLGLDPTGGTPDVTSPLSSVSGATACMPAGAAEGSCPMTVYDGTDYTVDSAAAGGVHVAAQWAVADSCIWLGSDTDGIDSPCGLPIPNSGSDSLFTLDSYTTPGVTFTGANWIMQINWN